MRLKMLTSISGTEYTLSPGDERDFPDNEAKRLVEAGYAVPVADAEPKRAVKRAPAGTSKRLTIAGIVTTTRAVLRGGPFYMMRF